MTNERIRATIDAYQEGPDEIPLERIISALEMLVPMAIARYKEQGYTAENIAFREDERNEAYQLLEANTTTTMYVLAYHDKRRRESKRSPIAEMARAIALLCIHSPSGVEFAGVHFYDR